MRRWPTWRWQRVGTIIGFASVAGLLAGCASTETQIGEAHGDRTYVTGSRIPVKDGSTSNSVRSVGNRDAAESIDERSRIYIPSKGGATQ